MDNAELGLTLASGGGVTPIQDLAQQAIAVQPQFAVHLFLGALLDETIRQAQRQQGFEQPLTLQGLAHG